MSDKRKREVVGDEEAQKTMDKAEKGDTKAMCQLGDWYCSEEHDLPQDDEESYCKCSLIHYCVLVCIVPVVVEWGIFFWISLSVTALIIVTLPLPSAVSM